MSERARVTVPVYTFITNETEQVYLQRRFQTGYMDGRYETPAVSVEEGEFPTRAAVRVLFKEASLVVSELDLELFHVYANLINDDPQLGLFFRAKHWAGEPTIREPDKCDDAGFFNLDDLPDLTPQVHDAIGRLAVAPAIEMSLYTDIQG